jgi:hypothetical protein
MQYVISFEKLRLGLLLCLTRPFVIRGQMTVFWRYELM